ncbi:MAG: aminotransferase class III-fold pyridoxal phosphate-dependent enzyme [Acidobacteriota bacterium]
MSDSHAERPPAVAIGETEAMGRWIPRRPVGAIERGEGSWLITEEGERLLDLTSGYGTAPLGHADPVLASALAQQSQRLWSAPSFLRAAPRASYLQALTSILPGGLDRVFLTNSGTESIEAGLKLARLATGRAGIVALRQGFHGRTLGALALTSNAAARRPEEVLASNEVRFVPRDDIAALDEAIDDAVAAVVVEVIQGEGGVHPCAEDFLVAARRLSRERGALLLVDEIQTGMARTGPLFASAPYEPDLMALAKGLGGGFPLGALAYTQHVEEQLKPGAHGSTFGGNALACACGEALLQVFRDDDVPSRVSEQGRWLGERLAELAEAVPIVREVRGRGLMWGLQLRRRPGAAIAALARDHGVLVLPAGGNVIRLLPPLNVSREELEIGLDALRAVLTEAVP